MDERVGKCGVYIQGSSMQLKGMEAVLYSNLDGTGEHYVKGSKVGTKRQGLLALTVEA